MHLERGAGKVLLSAPARTSTAPWSTASTMPTWRPGERMISNGSCTTNCLAPLAKVLHEGIGIASGIMTTIHAYTGDQPTLDRRHKDLYRARAAAMSMIPTSTGAAKALGEVLPDLEGQARRLGHPGAHAQRLAVDLTFVAGRT